MDEFDISEWGGGFDLGDMGGGFDIGDIDFSGLGGGFDLSDLGGDFGLGSLDLGGFDLGEAISFGDVLGALEGIDLGEAISFGDVLGSLGEQDFFGAGDSYNIEDILSSLGEDATQTLDYVDTSALSELGLEPGPSNVFEYGYPEIIEELESSGITKGLKLPGDASKTLFQTAEETAPRFLGEGLREPEVPGMSYLGGGTGIYKEVPTEFDASGEPIRGTGGYITQMGFIPYEATPALGDPRSFINDPRLLGRPVFTTDQVRLPDGTKVKVDPNTGRTTREVIKTDTKTDTKTTGGGGGGKGGGGGLGGLKDNNALLLALLGGLLGLLGRKDTPKLPVGYQGGIPKYTATRVPGRGVEYTRAAGGGLMDLAGGGQPARYLRGGTDGMADKIKTDIDGKQPARLSHGEFVIPADVVSHLGNGNSDAGADVLYEMMAKVRKARTGTPKQGKQINPQKYTPA